MGQRAHTFVDLAEGSTTELLDDSVAFVQNFLSLLKHYFNYNNSDTHSSSNRAVTNNSVLLDAFN